MPPDTNGCEFGNVCAPLGSEFTRGAVPWGTLAGWGVRIGTWADAVAGLLPGLLLMETGDNAPHQMSNLSENRKFGYAIQEIGRRCGGALTDDQVRRLHDEITRGGYTTDEIIEIGVAMFCPGS